MQPDCETWDFGGGNDQDIAYDENGNSINFNSTNYEEVLLNLTKLHIPENSIFVWGLSVVYLCFMSYTFTSSISNLMPF
jgi:hypothetical protein